MSTRNRTTLSLDATGTTTTGDLFPGTTPAELVEPIHGQPMTTSRRVAQMFGKEHKNVLRSVETLLPTIREDGFDRLNFEPTTYTDDSGREQREYLITKDGFMLLAMTFTGKTARHWQVAFVKAFNSMAKALQRQQRALMSADRRRIRAEVAREHTAVIAMLVETRREQGKETEAHHIANEGRLIGYAMTGEFMGVDRETLDADQLRILHRVETLDIKLLVRGVDWHARKDQLRALVLDAQAAKATVQSLELDDTPSRIEGST